MLIMLSDGLVCRKGRVDDSRIFLIAQEIAMNYADAEGFPEDYGRELCRCVLDCHVRESRIDASADGSRHLTVLSLLAGDISPSPTEPRERAYDEPQAFVFLVFSVWAQYRFRSSRLNTDILRYLGYPHSRGSDSSSFFFSIVYSHCELLMSARHSRGSAPPGCPTTNPTTTSARLLALPDEILNFLAQVLLRENHDVQGLLRLVQTCTTLAGPRLAATRDEAAAYRLMFDTEVTSVGCMYSDHHRAITLGIASYTRCWAVGHLIPHGRTVSFRVKIRSCRGNSGDICIGVCDADATCGWGVDMYDGHLRRYSRHGNQREHYRSAPPPGYPDGDGTNVMSRRYRYDYSLEPAGVGERLPPNLQGCAEGSVVEVILQGGTLSFSINSGPRLLALDSFPVGAEVLRPWARLVAFGDGVCFDRGYLDVFRS
jgi:hypothetical protein